MKKKHKKRKEISYERNNMKEQGYFDGRFSSQVIPNKKKNHKRKHKKKFTDEN